MHARYCLHNRSSRKPKTVTTKRVVTIFFIRQIARIPPGPTADNATLSRDRQRYYYSYYELLLYVKLLCLRLVFPAT